MATAKVKINITSDDGVLLDQIVLTDDKRTPEELARAVVDHIEARFETEPE
jgi:hypothetical protein